ncbi:prepilin-type N-terminal cleavage/methylation domain-containing protein [Persephonella sp.]
MNRKGFTLIELAMILVIIGVLIGIGVTTFSILIKRAKYAETKEIVNAAVDAITGYASSSGRIPTLTELNTVVRTLEDSYGKSLVYIYDRDLTNPSPYGHCGLNSTNISVQICDDSACSTSTTINNVAFIILSGDGNYNNQTAGSQEITTATTIRVFQYGVEVDNYPTDINRVEPYDDIVKWVTLHELQTKEGCESLTITTASLLPNGTEDSPYNYKLEAAGGRPPYQWGTWDGTTCNISATDVDLGNGLKMSSDGSIYGTINVEPASPPGSLSSCTSTINLNNICVKDSAGNEINSSFSINVYPQQLRIVTETLPTGYEGSDYNVSLSAFGGGTSYIWSGSLPPGLGLTLNSDGTITGTINSDPGCSNPSPYTFTVQVSSCSGSYVAYKAFALTVIDPDCSTAGSGGSSSCTPFSLSPPSGTAFSATVGTPFSQSITLSGGSPPITVTSCSPTTCNGLTFTCSNAGAVISGTPLTATSCTFSVSYVDSCSPQQSITGIYTVNASVPPTPPSCSLTANPTIVPYNGFTDLSWNITGYFTSGYFSPISGSCSTITNPSGVCTTGNLTTPGLNTFTLNVTNGVLTGSCSTDVYVGCQGYRVWNKTGNFYCFKVGADNIGIVYNNNEITSNTINLNPGEFVERYNPVCFLWWCWCNYNNSNFIDKISYTDAMNVDIQANGGDGDCRVNYTSGGAADR